MGVKLREKKLSNGQISYYLDIYHSGARWYEFLDIHVTKKRPDDADKEKKQLANEIRTKREHEIIVEGNGLNDKTKMKACFIDFMENHLKAKVANDMHYGVLKYLRAFSKNRPVPFAKITMIWLKDLESYMLNHVTNNTALSYLTLINGGLNEAVRRKIIHTNVWHEVPRHQRLKKQEIFRSAFTIEQLQDMINVDIDIKLQYKQGYFFGCFTGLRWSDVNQLRWNEIVKKQLEVNGTMEEHYFIYFEQEKTEGIEYLPLSDMAVEIIKEREAAIITEPVSAYVFPDLKEDNSKKNNNRKYQKVRFALKKWANKAGIDPKKLHFHSGRHTFATNVLECSNDGDLYTVSKLLGLKSIQHAQVYAKVRDKRKLAAVKALPKINFSLNSANSKET
jgi:integrase